MQSIKTRETVPFPLISDYPPLHLPYAQEKQASNAAHEYINRGLGIGECAQDPHSEKIKSNWTRTNAPVPFSTAAAIFQIQPYKDYVSGISQNSVLYVQLTGSLSLFTKVTADWSWQILKFKFNSSIYE